MKRREEMNGRRRKALSDPDEENRLSFQAQKSFRRSVRCGWRYIDGSAIQMEKLWCGKKK
jgi:hypothetical protein